MKRSANIISQKEAQKALKTAFEERRRNGTLHGESEDYFAGSCDRWSLVIQELNCVPPGGKILDIGAWDGILCSTLANLGYKTAAIDWKKPIEDSVWEKMGIEWCQCNIEADSLPFADNEFDVVYMGQILEHFTYSPRKAMQQIRRVLKSDGLLILDVPNISELHNFYRLIRGKNILFDYKKHYIDYEPVFYKGLPYFDRHNREFTKKDLHVLAETFGFAVVRIVYIRSRRMKRGIRRFETPFSFIRDLIPLFRKSLMLVARKLMND